MPTEPSAPTAVDQAISRALRENLERIQRTSDEVHQAVADVVFACSSTKPANALPPMLRAQAAAASLSASLDVLTRFVAAALQSGARSPIEAEIARITGPLETAAPESLTSPEPHQRQEYGSGGIAEEPRISEPPAASFEPATALAELPPVAGREFDVNRLSTEEQELHRRANRVAKVSMQDIKMLRPDQVRLGRENKDICIRLKDDIEKAHREYDRRFRPIMDHPVDYFYRWMVEILAEGDSHALGEYPYATAARQR